MKKTTATLLTLIALMLISVPAFAGSCRIHNTTKYTFRVETFNKASNQTVPSYAYASISSGSFIAKSTSGGKSFGGRCASGSRLRVKIVKGVLVTVPY